MSQAFDGIPTNSATQTNLASTPPVLSALRLLLPSRSLLRPSTKWLNEQLTVLWPRLSLALSPLLQSLALLNSTA